MIRILGLAGLLLFSSPAWADVVFLKGGQRLEGQLTEQGSVYALKTDQGTITVPKAEVEKVVPSPEAITAEAEALRVRARALYDEGVALEKDPKAANAKLKAGLELLRKIADLYAEATETYEAEKHPDLSKNLVRTFQEMRLYRDKLSSEVAAAPPGAPATPPTTPAAPPPPPPLPGLPAAPAGAIDLLALVDPARDAVKGAWRFDGKVLVGSGDMNATLQIPRPPPEEYDLELVVQRTGSPEAFVIGLVGGGAPFMAGLDGFSGTTSGLAVIDGKNYDANETTRKGPVFENDRPSTVRCSVRKDRVSISVDGKPIIDWAAGYARVSLKPMWAVRDSKSLFLGTIKSTYRVSRAVLLPAPLSPAASTPPKARPRVDAASLLVKAKAGDLEAQYQLGIYYDDEEGRPAAALEWLKPAAEKNHPRAQDRLGRLYLRGKAGVKEDFKEAQRWFGRAEAGGSPFGTYRMATMYFDAAGVKRDVAKADALAERCRPPVHRLAEAGDPEAQVAMGWMALTGMGADRNYDEAFAWYRKSAEQEFAMGMRSLGWLYQEGKGCAKNLNEAVKWLEKAAQKGDAGAMNDLGYLYNDPVGPERNPILNYEKAVAWYRKLVEREDGHGYYNLGRMYMSGGGVPKNEAEGMRLWREAIKVADHIVFRHLHHAIAWVYRQGKAGQKADINEAMRYLKTAADAGFARAMHDLGDCYLELKNEREAVRWTVLGAKNGDHFAQNRLGFFFHTGKGVKKDLDEAERWYLAAAQQGYDVAVKNLDLVRRDKAAPKKP
jgi:hypothetical protein